MNITGGTGTGFTSFQSTSFTGKLDVNSFNQDNIRTLGILTSLKVGDADNIIDKIVGDTAALNGPMTSPGLNTNLVTEKAIAAYVDGKIENQDTLAELLAKNPSPAANPSNTTGGTDIDVSSTDDINLTWNTGTSVGAKIFVCATNMPAGLGEPIFARLDADIASAMMSINATKGVEVGSGFSSVSQKGTEHSDEMASDGFKSNNAGGILGGISSGQDIEVNVAFKPTSSIPQDRSSINLNGKTVQMKTTGRHDPCVAIRAVPITEAMLALVLIDHVLRDRAQNMDVKRINPFPS